METSLNLKTSNEWQQIYPEVVVLDPDGWDRTNFMYEWFEEKITLTEYNNRLMASTCKGNFRILPFKEITE